MNQQTGPDDFSTAARAPAARTRHPRPKFMPRAWPWKAITARTRAARAQLDAFIADAPALADVDALPVIAPMSGRAPVVKPKPPKPVAKNLLPRPRVAPPGFRLHSLPPPDENLVDGSGEADVASERARDPAAGEAAARDHGRAAGGVDAESAA